MCFTHHLRATLSVVGHWIQQTSGQHSCLRKLTRHGKLPVSWVALVQLVISDITCRADVCLLLLACFVVVVDTLISRSCIIHESIPLELVFGFVLRSAAHLVANKLRFRLRATSGKEWTKLRASTKDAVVMPHSHQCQLIAWLS
jgi:hypothetical protein